MSMGTGFHRLSSPLSPASQVPSYMIFFICGGKSGELLVNAKADCNTYRSPLSVAGANVIRLGA